MQVLVPKQEWLYECVTRQDSAGSICRKVRSRQQSWREKQRIDFLYQSYACMYTWWP